MRFKGKRSGLVVAALAVASVAAISVAMATTPTIKPEGDGLLATSNNAHFKIGSLTIVCPYMQLGGKIPSPGSSSMALSAPSFYHHAIEVENPKFPCTDGVKGSLFGAPSGSSVHWELKVNSTSSASVVIPKNGFHLEAPGAKCHIEFARSGSVTASAVFSKGFSNYGGSGLAFPSSIEVAETSLPVLITITSECPTGLLEGAKKEGEGYSTFATFFAWFDMSDGTNVSEIVKFE